MHTHAITHSHNPQLLGCVAADSHSLPQCHPGPQGSDVDSGSCRNWASRAAGWSLISLFPESIFDDVLVVLLSGGIIRDEGTFLHRALGALPELGYSKSRLGIYTLGCPGQQNQAVIPAGWSLLVYT